jgi:dienelactone hydrolase
MPVPSKLASDIVGLSSLFHRSRRCERHSRQPASPRQFKLYAEAPHGFHADYRASYRKDAAEDASREMTAWFKTHKVLS